MGRSVKKRDSYLGDALAVKRIADAACIDPDLSSEQLEEVKQKTAALVAVLTKIESERTANGID